MTKHQTRLSHPQEPAEGFKRADPMFVAANDDGRGANPLAGDQAAIVVGLVLGIGAAIGLAAVRFWPVISATVAGWL